MDTNYDADSCLQFCVQTLFSSYAAALEIMSVMEEDKGRNEYFRRERVKKICSRELADMLLKTPRLQHTALTAENEVGLSLGFCCVAVIAGWDDEALLLCQESPLCRAEAEVDSSEKREEKDISLKMQAYHWTL
ncbi:unnamed protein product [Sphagnum balticum]